MASSTAAAAAAAAAAAITPTTAFTAAPAAPTTSAATVTPTAPFTHEFVCPPAGGVVDASRLAPGVAGLLASIAAAGPPVDPGSVSVATRRKLLHNFIMTHGGDLAPLPRIEDVAIEVSTPRSGGPSRSLALRLYYPAIPAAGGGVGAPGYLLCHGGGWHAGSLTTHDNLCRRLAAGSGCVFASLDYRLAPEAPVPAGVEDAVAAYDWLAAAGAARGVDPTRLGLAGDSGGATIVTAACAQLCARHLAAPGSGSVPPPAALFLLYPSLDLTCSTGPSYTHFAEGYYLRTASIRHYVSLYVGDSGRAVDDPLVSPFFTPDATLAAFPPTAVITAGFDPLLSDGEAFTAKLRRLGVPVAYTCFTSFIHVFAHLASIAPEVDDALTRMAATAASLMRRA